MPSLTDYLNALTIDEIEADPYPLYARLRHEAPVAYVPALNSYLVTRWTDVQTVTKSPERFTAHAPDAPVVRAFGDPAIIHCDGDIHSHLRGGIAPHYLPAKVRDYIAALVEPIADDALEQLTGATETDLLAHYFEPISVQSLARSFGIDSVSTDTLREWFHGLALGAINFGRDPVRAQQCQDTIDAINLTLDPVFERLYQTHDESPLSHLLRIGMPEGALRAREEVMPTVLVTLLGGMQEPGHAAATTLYALLADPPLLDAVRADRSLLPQAIDEGLRWVAPIGTQVRTAVEDTELGGVTLKAGNTVSAVIASACHDESRYTDPATFDLHRKDGGHAAFGFGAHLCVGKWFAKAQVEIALNRLLDHYPTLTLNGEVQFNGWEFRAPQSLPVRLSTPGHTE